jgi:RES domain-containing protein
LALDIDRVPVRGIWWRQVAAGLEPLALRDPPGDGRWQRGDVVGATYFADSEQTVWAEWYRALAERAVPPAMWLPCDLWGFEVDLEEVADLSIERRLRAAGLDPPRPNRRTWPPYQAVGEQLAAEGASGLVAPSASRPEGLVLCLFRGEDRPAGVSPSGRPRRIAEPPVPPRGLHT